MLLLNTAIANAMLGDASGVLECCNRFSTSKDSIVVDRDWWVNKIRDESTWIATRVDLEADAISSLLMRPFAEVVNPS